MWNIIGWIVVGGIAGALAKLILPGKDPGGIIVTILIGIVGALIAGWLGGLIFQIDLLDGGWSWQTLITGIIGALLLLVVYRLITGRMGAGSSRRT